MAKLTTFHTSHLVKYPMIVLFFETSVLLVSNMAALSALYNICFIAIFGLMTHFVAFKTHFLIAVKGIVSVLPTEDAGCPFCFVWTFFLSVAELSAVVAFYSWIFLSPVPRTFIFSQIFKGSAITIFFKVYQV